MTVPCFGDTEDTGLAGGSWRTTEEFGSLIWGQWEISGHRGDLVKN